MPSEAKAIAAAERRIKKWMEPKIWKDNPDFDSPAFDRMAKQILGVMASVGPAYSVEGIAALTKALALVVNKAFDQQPIEVVEGHCQHLGSTIAAEIALLRLPSIKKAMRNN